MKIKNLLSLVLILFFTQSYFAQFYGGALYQLKNAKNIQTWWAVFDADYRDNQEGFLTAKKRKELGVKEISYKRTDKKGRVSNTKLTYNNYGRLLSSKSDKFERKSTYLNDTLETSRFTSRKGKTEEFKLVFDQSNKILVDERYSKGKLSSKTENSYSNGNLIYAKLFQKGKLYEMKYSYNEENKLTKSEFYKRGKLKQYWVYECKPEGQIVASNKAEIISSKCEYREESADGSYAIYTRTITKGKPYLVKQTFSKDSIKIKEETFIKDSILTYSWQFENNTMSYKHYHKGKLTRTFKSIYNSQHKCIEESFYRKNKLKRLEIFNYDSKGNETLYETYNGEKKKLSFVRTKKYDEMGNNILEENSHKKNRKVQSKKVKEFNPNGTLKSYEYFSKDKFMSKREFEYVIK